MILKNIEKLAVDANPLLSAIIGGQTRTVFLNTPKTTFYTTLFNYKEVEKYIPILSTKRKIPIEDLYFVFSMLPLSVCDEDFYKNKIKQAKRMIEKRDPADVHPALQKARGVNLIPESWCGVHLFALGLKLGCPVWSNDKDFKGLGIEVYSTLDLIR